MHQTRGLPLPGSAAILAACGLVGATGPVAPTSWLPVADRNGAGERGPPSPVMCITRPKRGVFYPLLGGVAEGRGGFLFASPIGGERGRHETETRPLRKQPALEQIPILCSRSSFLRKQESSPNPRPSVRPERSKAKSKDWMPDQVRHDESATPWLQPNVKPL